MSNVDPTAFIPTPSMAEGELWLIDKIREGDTEAWKAFIARYEGRLLAFVEQRLSQRSYAEDIVQETLVGFLISLPNYDGKRSLESYLFSICSYKLTDHLRRLARKPTRSLDVSTGSGTLADRVQGPWKAASSIVRSNEQRELEERALVAVLKEQIDKWRSQKDWLKLACIELLVVAGVPNRLVAQRLDISEQKVANFKSDFIARTKQQLAKLSVSSQSLDSI